MKKWISKRAEIGLAPTKSEIIVTAEEISGKKIGGKWWKLFCRRNSEFSCRKAEITSSKKLDVPQFVVEQTLVKFKEICDKRNINNNSKIYNMDETGIVMDTKSQKVFAPKKLKRLKNRSSGNKEQVSVINCISADGQNYPPFLIFKGTYILSKWAEEAPNDYVFRASPSGWSSNQICTEWAEKIMSMIYEKEKEWKLLIVDGHGSHLTLKFLDLCEKYHFDLLCLPSNTTHLLQPLDLSVFRSFKEAWKENARKFLKLNGGNLKKENFCEIYFRTAEKSFTSDNIISGFKEARLFIDVAESNEIVSENIQTTEEWFTEDNVYSSPMSSPLQIRCPTSRRILCQKSSEELFYKISKLILILDKLERNLLKLNETILVKNVDISYLQEKLEETSTALENIKKSKKSKARKEIAKRRKGFNSRRN